jgi:putative aldouronate transport system substrate-binding protein
MRKSLVFLLVVIMAISVISGCSRDTTAPKDDTPSKTSTPSGKEEAPATKEQGKVTIKVFGPSNVEEFPEGEDENNNLIIDFLREQTGYDIKWEIAPKENAREKINLMMTSGVDCPDLIVSGDRNMGLDFIKEGILHPIDEYVKNTKNLAGLLDETANKMMAHDGKTYAVVVPQNQEATHALIVRGDWLENVGIEKLPSTLDEIKAAMEAFKANDPNCIPFTGSFNNDPLQGLTAFRGAFGVATEYRIAGDVLEPTCITEDMKSLLSYAAELYQDGLLDPEYPTNKADKVNEKLISGRSGMVSSGWADMKNRHDALAEKDPNGKFIWTNPEGPDGRKGQVMNSPARIYFFLPIHSKIPQDVINFIDIYVEEDVKNVVSYGWEGEHYEIKDGLIVATPKAEEIRYRIYYQLWDSKEDFLNRVYLKGFGKDYDAMKPFATVQDPMWYAPLIPVKQDKAQVLSDITNQYFIKFITNALPLDQFDKYVQEWKSSGGDEVVAAVNEWYESSK